MTSETRAMPAHLPIEGRRSLNVRETLSSALVVALLFYLLPGRTLAQDTTAPRVVSIAPAGVVANEGSLREIRVAFDEPVEIPDNAVRVHSRNLGYLRGLRVRYDDASDELVIPFARDPETAFFRGSAPGAIVFDVVTVVLDSSITDLSGNALDGEILSPLTPSFPSGDGIAGGQVAFQVATLPGDANRDGVVDAADLETITQSLGTCDGDPGFDEFSDLDDSGCVDDGDRQIAMRAIGRSLPATDGVAPTASIDPARYLGSDLATITVTFSEPMNRHLLVPHSLLLREGLGSPIVPTQVSLSSDGTVAIFELGSPLPQCATYFVTLGNGLLDLSGHLPREVGMPILLSGFVPPAPILDPHPGMADASPIVISGEAPGAVSVRAIAPTGIQESDVGSDGSFSFSIEILENHVSTISFIALSECDDSESAPATTDITFDAQPPHVSIQFPQNETEVSSESLLVSGFVGDALSGFMGLDVTVNGVDALVDVGIGSNGTFVTETPVPLTPGLNVLTATATDAHGNVAVSVVEVFRVEIPMGTPTITMISGDGQTGEALEVLGSPLAVQVQLGDGSPLPGKVVNFAVTRSDGFVSDGVGGLESQWIQVVTDGDGQAQVLLRLGTDAGCGNNQVTATSTGVAGDVFFFASAVSADPTQIRVGMGNHQMVEVASPAPDPLRVFVSDGNNPVAGVPVTFSVASGGGHVNGEFEITVPTDTTGHTLVDYEAGAIEGLQVIVATFPGNPGLPATFFIQALARDESLPTSFAGVVLDNSGSPIGGAEVEIEVGGTTSPVVYSEEDGTFLIMDIPAGPGYLHVDGQLATTVAGLPATPGVYPALHFEVAVVANVANRMPMPVYLPVMSAENVRFYSTGLDTVLEPEGIEGLRFTITAGSMSQNGIPAPSGTPVSLNQVHFDEIPMPLPDGAAPPFAWTLQPSGATFDPPVKIEMPNMAALAPGSVCYFLSFDHDANRFQIVATGSVTADGASLVSAPGEGISKAGWGGFCPPYPIPTRASDTPAFIGDFGASGGGAAPGGPPPAGSPPPPAPPGGDGGPPPPPGGGSGPPPPSLPSPVGGGPSIGSPGVTGGPTTTDGRPQDAYVDNNGNPCPDLNLVQGNPYHGSSRAKGVHLGIDIFAPVGTEVFAVADGVVQLSHFDPDFLGHFIVIYHDVNGFRFRSAYNHLSARFVEVGDEVLALDLIGLTGVSGNACDPTGVWCVPEPFLGFQIIGPGVTPVAEGIANTADPLLYFLGEYGPVPQVPPQPIGEPSPPLVKVDLSLLGDVARPFPNGCFELGNMPFTPGLHRVRGGVEVGGIRIPIAAQFRELVPNGSIEIDPKLIEFEPDPAPASLTATPGDVVLSDAQMQTQIVVTAVLPGGATKDVTPRALGTTYTSSNEDIVTVDDDGLAMAVGPGVAFVTATNEGATAVVALLVALGDPLTTVQGVVYGVNGVPFQSATVTVSPGDFTSSVDANGFFSIAGVPTELGSITVEARGTAAADDELFAIVGPVAPVPGGITDVGILDLRSAVFWIGGDGSWHEGSNWSTGSPPVPGDDVLIDRPGILTITVSQGAQAAGKLLSEENLVISGGSLTVDDETRLTGTLTLSGVGELDTPILLVHGAFSLSGTLTNAVVLASPAGVGGAVSLQGSSLCHRVSSFRDFAMADGSTLQIEDSLYMNGTLRMFGASASTSIVFLDATKLSGTGEIIFDGTSSVRNRVFAQTGLFFNQTTIRSGTGGGQVGNSGTSFVNQGVVIAGTTGTVTLTGDAWQNVGVARAESGGTLAFDGTYSNDGIVEVADSTLRLGGTFEIEDLGFLALEASTVRISGTIQDSILDIGDGSILWILDGGTILNGAVVGSGAVLSVDSISTVDGATLEADLVIPNGKRLQVLNGLTVNGTLRFSSASFFTTLAVLDGSTLAGSGEILFDGRGFLRNQIQGDGFTNALTIRTGTGAGTVGQFGMSWINQGTIIAETPGKTMELIGMGWTNDGVVAATGGGTLQLSGTFTNGGTISMTDSTVRLGGTFELANLGTFETSGGTVRLTGVLENSTLDIGDGSTAWLLDGGTILDSSVVSGGGVLSVDSNSLADGATFEADVLIPNGERLEVQNGLTVNGTLRFLSTSSFTTLAFLDTSTLAGSGEVLFDGTGFQRNQIHGSFTNAMTIRSGTAGGVVGQFGASFVNQGAIIAETPGRMLELIGTGWTNESVVSVSGGCTLQLSGTFTNSGTIAMEDSTVRLGGTFQLADLGAFVTSGGTVEIFGTLGDSTLDIGDGSTTWVLDSGTLLNSTVVASGGVLSIDGIASVVGSTLEAEALIPNGQRLRVQNDLTVNGTLTMASESLFTTLEFLDASTLSGSGELVLNGTGFLRNQIYGPGFTNDLTIRTGSGGGILGQAGSSFVNQGSIISQNSARTVQLLGTGWINAAGGILQAIGGGELLSSGTWTNEGSVLVEAGSTFEMVNPYLQTGGETTVNALLSAPGVDLQGGALHGAGTIESEVSSAGTVSPGDGIGTLSVSGDYTEDANSFLDVEIEGVTDFDQLLVNGEATLAGNLVVSLLNGFVPNLGDVYPIMVTSSLPVGSFVNGAGGIDIAGPLRFQVDYSATGVALEVVPD